jgi:hypothetical protein
MVMNQQMYMVGCSGVIEDYDPEPLPRLEKPVEPCLPVPGKLQTELLLVATMSYMPHMTGDVIPARSWHILFSSLRSDISPAKWWF